MTPDSPHVLDAILDRVAARADAVVVFDLDSTLFSTDERNLAIMREAAARYPAIAPIVAGWGPGDIGWNFRDDLRRAGVADEAVLAAVAAFWKERFFAGDYLVHDVPVPGAPAYVWRVHRAGGRVCYLTGRDRPGMAAGTVASLRTHGFPWDLPRVELIMKRAFEIEDADHKREAIAHLRALGEVVAAFDNEPELVNLFVDEFPAATVVMIDTVHSPKPIRPYPHVAHLTDFLPRL